MSFLSESVTLGLAVRSIRRSARKESMTFTEFVLSGYDPCVNVVLLEVGSLMLILILPDPLLPNITIAAVIRTPRPWPGW